MSKDCFVFIEGNEEIADISLQLLSEAQRIKQSHSAHVDNVVALYLTSKSASLDPLYQYGADKVILVEDERFAPYHTVVYADVIKDIVDSKQPSIFLIGGSIIGRDLAPRISAKLQTGLTADTTHLTIEDETGLFLMTRPAFGGNINATIICAERTPQMATVRDNVFEKEAFDLPHSEVEVITPKSTVVSKIKVVKETAKPVHNSNIKDARIVVSCGRGVSDSFEAIKRAAKVLNGEVGASRAVVDQHIAEKQIQVGQTGSTIRPVIYIACGISGAIQHVAGMDKSELIIAINTDPKAPIFDVADIGLVVDAKKVLPLLEKTIQDNQ